MAKNIFITGGSTGIGAASVVKFAAMGWNVCFMDTNVEAAESLLCQLNNSSQIKFVKGNVCSINEVHSAVEAALAQFGHLDSVFANAGIHRNNTLLNISDEELDLMIQTNIYGTINTLRKTTPHLIANGGGSIVINSSDQWFIGKPNSFAYGLTKGALGQITRSLSIDLGQYNIRVNAICPGTIATPLANKAMENFAKIAGISTAETWEQENALYARGSAGKPEEVAELVYFLASDASSFCTGSHYLIDGGLVAK